MYINPKMVVWANIEKPLVYKKGEDVEMPFSPAPHGWRIQIVFGFDGHGSCIYEYINFDSQYLCELFIKEYLSNLINTEN